jgi:hypothetical protein
MHNSGYMDTPVAVYDDNAHWPITDWRVWSIEAPKLIFAPAQPCDDLQSKAKTWIRRIRLAAAPRD